jgi:hypothetical protein
MVRCRRVGGVERLREELRDLLEHPRWQALRFRYTDWLKGPEETMPWEVTHARPGAWRIRFATPVGDELITDGTRSWVVEDGVAIVDGFGRIVVSHRLENLLDPLVIVRAALCPPPRRGRPVPWEQVAVNETELEAGRSGLVVDFGEAFLALDRASGVGVRLWEKKDETAERVLEDLDVDPDLPAGTFAWNGPTDRGRSPGLVSVVEEDGLFDADWSVGLAGRYAYSERGPRRAPATVALAWARERAREVRVRDANGKEYSAGDRPPSGEMLPPWQS